MNNKKNSKENGITLIALVITIIIMLILAAVTINIVINGGLIGYAKDAKIKTLRAQMLERIQLAYTEVILDNKGQGTEEELAELTVSKLRDETEYSILDKNQLGTVDTLIVTENEITLKQNKNTTVEIDYGEEPAVQTKYFIKIENNYYELTLKKDEIKIADNIITEEEINTLGSNNSLTITVADEGIITVQRVGKIITITGDELGETTVTVSIRRTDSNN